MELIIVTGMSGAGKSQAANALEDIGFYCVDNIPPSLISAFVDMGVKGRSEFLKLAIVTDIRGGELFSELSGVIRELKSRDIDLKILFLDASDETLARRYKETRRTHPLSSGGSLSVIASIEKEREVLKSVRAVADYIIDSTQISVGQLKQRIFSIFLGNSNMGLNIQCMSFGFKYGIAAEADLVFDVRCLPNPFYIDELRPLTGQDQPIRDYVMSFEQTKEFSSKLLELLDCAVPLYCSEGKSQLVIAIGCTGGKHRSVVMTELVYNHLLQKGYRVSVNHRDIVKA